MVGDAVRSGNAEGRLLGAAVISKPPKGGALVEAVHMLLLLHRTHFFGSWKVLMSLKETCDELFVAIATAGQE